MRGEAEAELRRFDLLGTIERLPQLVAVLRRRLCLPALHKETIDAVRPCGGAGMAESEQTFYYNESRAITWDAVGNATRARWFVAAEV